MRSPKYKASFIINSTVLPSVGLSQAVATQAIGTSVNGVYSPMNGDTFTLVSVNHRGIVLAPATQVSACESSSVRLISLAEGLWIWDRSITRSSQGSVNWMPFAFISVAIFSLNCLIKSSFDPPPFPSPAGAGCP